MLYSVATEQRDAISGISLVAVLALVMFLALGTGISYIVSGSVLFYRYTIYVSALSILLFAVLFIRLILSAAFINIYLAALITLVSASAIWSMDVATTIVRLPSFLACTLLGVLVGRAMSLRELTRFMSLLGAAVAVLCLAATALFPAARGAPPWDEAWRGIFLHKNDLGAACAITLPFVIHAVFRNTRPKRYLFAACSVVLLVLLFESESRTGQLIGALAVISLGLSMLLRRFRFVWASVTAAIFILGVVGLPLVIASGAAQPLFEWIGREPTLSGRVPLWRVIWPWIEQRPLLGYGYASFWEAMSERVQEITSSPAVQWEVHYSHNGALETLLDVGAIGLGLLVAVYVQSLFVLLILLRRHPDVDDLVPMLILLITFLLANLTEVTVLQRESLMWMMFVAIAMRLSVLLSAEQFDLASPPSDRHLPSHGLHWR